MKQKHHWLLVAGIVIGVLGVAVVGATIDTVAGADTTQPDGLFDHDGDHHAAHQDDRTVHPHQDGHTDHHDHAHADGEFTDRNDTRHPDEVHGEYPHDSPDEYHPRDSTDEYPHDSTDEYHPRDSTDEYHPRDSTDEYHPRDSTDHHGPCH